MSKVHIAEGWYTWCGRRTQTGIRVLVGLGDPRKHPEICKKCIKSKKFK